MLKNFRTFDLAVQLYRGCEQVQAKSHLKDQLLRASLSIVLNTSEGSAKPTAKDRRRFYGIALGSCREVQALLMLLKQDALFQLSDQVGGCLYKLTHSS
ncbi:MAG: four helix bundle protein [Oligoflexia bacterium]|nr:four helix bundle protein [Oligoflexia bacterium]